MFVCLECSRKFRTVAAAQRAANNGCPGCGGVDIDLDVKAKVPTVFPRPSDGAARLPLRADRPAYYPDDQNDMADQLHRQKAAEIEDGIADDRRENV